MTLTDVFNPEKNKKNGYTRPAWVEHLAGLLPLTGRETGTGHSGMSFINRGGDYADVWSAHHARPQPKCTGAAFWPNRRGEIHNVLHWQCTVSRARALQAVLAGMAFPSVGEPRAFLVIVPDLDRSAYL